MPVTGVISLFLGQISNLTGASIRFEATITQQAATIAQQAATIAHQAATIAQQDIQLTGLKDRIAQDVILAASMKGIGVLLFLSHCSCSRVFCFL
jgi:uncharacterized coiled-coil protein SlyX